MNDSKDLPQLARDSINTQTINMVYSEKEPLKQMPDVVLRIIQMFDHRRRDISTEPGLEVQPQNQTPKQILN